MDGKWEWGKGAIKQISEQLHKEPPGPDLLFFNRELVAWVCVEIKREGFKPTYLSQLSAYLRILEVFM